MKPEIKSNSPLRIAFHTLGCKTNQFETQALEQLFQSRGHTLVPFDGTADVYIVNTCTVTALADKKSRNACRRCKKLNPEALLIVCGCFAQMNEEAVRDIGADCVVGSGDKGRILALAEQHGVTDGVADLWHGERPGFELLPAGGLSGRTRALLKVQDGCQLFCTYCLIPFARGPSRSMPFDTAVEEAARLSREGYREIVITGIEISCYGDDLPQRPNLAGLISAICTAAPDCRIRLGSLEPRVVTEEFVRTVAQHSNLCAHFHLSLQSGCDKVLEAMNRRYTTARYQEACLLLRRYFDDPAITTDLIVGFPGESEADFCQTLDFLRQCQPSKTHIFPYSARKGTWAAAFPGQIPRIQREERAARAAQVCSLLEQQYLERQAGKAFSVLFERQAGDCATGHTPQYCVVNCPAEKDLAGELRQVMITGFQGEALIGRIL